MNFTSPPESREMAGWNVSFDMNVNKKILFLLTLNLVCFYTFQAILGETSTGVNEGESTYEYKSDVVVEVGDVLPVRTHQINDRAMLYLIAEVGITFPPSILFQATKVIE